MTTTWQNLAKLFIKRLSNNTFEKSWCTMSPTGRSSTRLSAISTPQPASKSGCRHPKSNHTPTKQGRNAQNPRNFPSKSHLLSYRSGNDKVPGLLRSVSPICPAYLPNLPLWTKNEKCFQEPQAIFLPISPTAMHHDHKTRPGVL